jgi:hypothetical protein
MKSTVTIEEIKSAYDVPRVWRELGLEGDPGSCVPSPFREDRRASFSVYDGGRRWKDHSGHGRGGGDVVDFVAEALRCNTTEALKWFRDRIEGRATSTPPPKRSACNSSGTQVPRKKTLPNLRIGGSEELKELAALRGLSVSGLALAQDRGILRFSGFAGSRAWAVTDGSSLVELRRMDGRPWAAYKSLPERKAHCIAVEPGAKSRPVGIEVADRYGSFLLVEGAPDALSACEALHMVSAVSDVGVLAVLGGAARIDHQAATALVDRHVRIIPHCDKSGSDACVRWAETLADAGACVDKFNLDGLTRADGVPVKDLNDVFLIPSAEVHVLVNELIGGLKR